MVAVNVETELVDVLEAVSFAGGRVYPTTRPQNATYPLITYLVVSSVPEDAFNRAQLSRRTRMQIECWARTHHDAMTLAQEVTTAVLGFFGNQVPVYSLWIENEREGDESTSSGLHRRLIDIGVLHG